MPNILQEDPVLSAITVFLTAAIALLAAFGLAFTTAQVGAIVAFVAATYAIVVLVVRRMTTPTANPKLNDGTPLVPAGE